MWATRRLGAAVILGTAVAAFNVGAPAVHASDQVPVTITMNAHDTLFPCGPTLCFANTGTGTASHLGAITTTGSAYVTSFTISGTQLVVTTVENYTITAANGDTIFLTNTGMAVEDLTTGVAQITGSWQITGGTGRFAGASGQGTTTGTAIGDLAAGTLDGTFSLVGTMSSVGSLH